MTMNTNTDPRRVSFPVEAQICKRNVGKPMKAFSGRKKSELFNFSTVKRTCRSKAKLSKSLASMHRREAFEMVKDYGTLALNATELRVLEHAITVINDLLFHRFCDVIAGIEADVIRLVCRTFRPNSKETSFVYTVCRFITILGKNSAQHCVCISKLIDVMLCEDLLRIHYEGCITVHKAIIEAFTALQNASESHRQALTEPESRCFEWIFAYLRRWKESEEMQLAILEFFRTALEDEEELKVLAVKRGLLVDMNSIIEQFPNSYGVRYLVLDTVVNLTDHSTEIRKQSIIEGHLSKVFETLDIFRGTPETVYMVCQAVKNYASELQIRDFMGKNGVIQELLRTLRNMLDPSRDIYLYSYRQVLRELLLALRILIFGSQANRLILLDITKLQIIKEVVRTYKYDKHVVVAGLEVLETLCGDFFEDKAKPPCFLYEPSKRDAFEDIIRYVSTTLSENKDRVYYAEHTCSVLLQVCGLGCDTLMLETAPGLRRLIPQVIDLCFEKNIVLNVAISLVRYIQN